MEESQEKKPIGNGLTNESEDSGNNSEQEPCLPQDLKSEKDLGLTDTLDSKHLDTEMMKQNKKRHNVNKKPHVSLWVSVSSSFFSLVKCLKEKTGLSNVGLAIAAIIMILFVICAIALLIALLTWPTVPHEFSFPSCRRSACLRSSSEILPRMNANVSACDDFREFACGRWLKNQRLPEDRSEWSLRRQLEYKTRDRIRQLITTQPHPTQHNSFAWKSKYFYDSCMAVDNIETAKDLQLTSEISELGGWEVLREFQVHSFDFSHTLTRVHSKFGVNLFFKIDVVPDPASGQDYIIQISPSELGLPDKSYYYRSHSSVPVVTYKQYLKDVAQLLGATTSAASKFSEDTFYFEKRLAEITPDLRDLYPLKAAHKMTVADLKSFARIPLYDILSSKFPEGNINDDTTILVPYPEHLSNISNILTTTDNVGLNNYMMWRLTESILPYLSEKFRDTVSSYRRDLFGEKQPLPRWEFCIQTMQKFMGFGLSVFLQNHADNFDQDSKVAKDLFLDIVRDAKRTVHNSGWLPQELQEHITGKLMTMGLEIGFPQSGNLLSDSNLEEMYRQFFVINREFFRNVRSGIAFLQNQQQMRLNKFDEVYRWMDAASNFDLKVRYIASANKVVIPQALLQEPYFHPDYPLSVLFGGLGVEIASAVVQGITPWDVLYTDDGTLLVEQHPAVNQSRRAFMHPLYCLRQWWGSEGFASQHASNKTAQNALIKLSAVNVAFRTLREQLKYLPHTHQPALENFEDGHLFFIAFAQSTCAIKSDQQKDLDRTLDISLDDKSLLSIVLSQTKEFKKLFSCSAGNVLYTEIPCEDVF